MEPMQPTLRGADMKLQFAITAALAAQLFAAAPSIAGFEIAAPGTDAAASPRVADCPAKLVAQPQPAPDRIQSIEGIEVDGQMFSIALVATGRKSVCAVQTGPEPRALSAAEYADLQQLSALQSSGGLPNLTAGEGTTKTMSAAAIALVYPGYCGASSTPIASAFFLAQRLALS